MAARQRLPLIRYRMASRGGIFPVVPPLMAAGARLNIKMDPGRPARDEYLMGDTAPLIILFTSNITPYQSFPPSPPDIDWVKAIFM